MKNYKWLHYTLECPENWPRQWKTKQRKSWLRLGLNIQVCMHCVYSIKQSLVNSITVTSNNETLRKLKKIFDGFRDAAKTYSKVKNNCISNKTTQLMICLMQEDCLNNAEHCLSQARLVALQLSVLSKNKQVINLEPKAVLKYMEDQPFTEVFCH